MPQASIPSMAITLPPADCLLAAGTWCALLARQVAGSRSLEWTMRLQASVYNSGAPRARFPDGVPVPRHHIGAGGSPWFSCRDVAAWLAGMGYIVTHEEDAFEDGAEVLQPEPPADEKWSLTNKEVAWAFRDLRGWNEKRWGKELGDPPTWLIAARIIEGERNVRVSTWHPVTLGDLLITKFDVPVRTVRARFQIEPLLQPWLPAWMERQKTNWPDEQ